MYKAYKICKPAFTVIIFLLNYLCAKTILEVYMAILHNELNPRIFDEKGNMRENIRGALLKIVQEFLNKLNQNEIPISVVDYRLVGSNAAYNYSAKSDMDIHIIADLSIFRENEKLLQLLYDYFKSNFNDKYDIKVKGMEVELYIEDASKGSISNGVYSIKEDKWIKKPKHTTVLDIDITKSQQYQDLYKQYQELKDDEVDDFIDNLYVIRKVSLSKNGEFGDGNLIFKAFRDNGYLDDLRTRQAEIKSRELSLESLEEAVSPQGYAPKKTGKAYKVFKVKNGKLYPPMVANSGGKDTPIGVWLDAEEGEFAGLSKTGRPKVKSTGGEPLAYRPGWHLGDIPRAKQFDRLNKETGEYEFPKDFVWAECDYAMDVDYQPESDAQGYMRTKRDEQGNVITYKSDKYQHSLAGLPKLPKDGYYKYRTNPNPDTVPWVITGQMKVNRLLSDDEVNAILKKNGIAPIHRQGGDKSLGELGLQESLEESFDRYIIIHNSPSGEEVYRTDDFQDACEELLHWGRAYKIIDTQDDYKEYKLSDAKKFLNGNRIDEAHTVDKIKLAPEQDRRRKLTDEDKEEIRRLYATGFHSLNSLAKQFGVSKKLILITVNPESRAKNDERIKNHWKDYYDTQEHTSAVRDTRAYKKDLLDKGELKKVDESVTFGEYTKAKDTKYKKIQSKPINTLTVEDICYIYFVEDKVPLLPYTNVSYDDNMDDLWSDTVDSMIDSEDVISCYEYLHKLTFPLTIYRGIRSGGYSSDEMRGEHGDLDSLDISGKNNSRSWTTNINIYKAKNSMFKNLTNIVACEVNSDVIDNATTVSCYIHYTSRPQYGMFGEYEITLKKNFKKSDLHNLRFVDKTKITEDIDREMSNEYDSEGNQLTKAQAVLKEVYPNKGESKKDFIARFMSVTKNEYPDVKQRYAVANSYWERRNKKRVNESNDADSQSIIAYHSSPNKFTKFDKKYIDTATSDGGMYGKGFYFADKELAQQFNYSGYLYKVKLLFSKPYILNTDKDRETFEALINAHYDSKTKKNNSDLTDFFNAGYDGVISNNEIWKDELGNKEKIHSQFVVYDPSQITILSIEPYSLDDNYNLNEATLMHWGDLDYGRKADRRAIMAGRGTGHFGTGFYFVSKDKYDDMHYDYHPERPIYELDTDSYKLFKPKSVDDAYALHDALKSINDYAREDNVELLGYFDKCDRMHRDLNKLEDKIGYEDGWENDVLEFTKKYGAPWLVDRVEYMIQAENWYDLERFPKRIYDAYVESHDEVRDAIRTIEKITKTYRNLESIIPKAASHIDAEDSISTEVMKALGFEGIDVSHLQDENGWQSPDNFKYGSVIYDLKPNTYRRVKEPRGDYSLKYKK